MSEKNYIEMIEKVKLIEGVFIENLNFQSHILQIILTKTTKYILSLNVIF